MKFLRNLVAAILGSMIGVFLLFFFMMIIFAAIGSMSDKEVVVKNHSVLKLDLAKPIKDRVEDNPFADFKIGMFSKEGAIGLQDILSSIDKAKRDKRIEGIVLNVPQISGSFGGMAFLKEIRTKLQDFKKSGKFVYAYNKYGYSQSGYWLASVADSVFMHPQGGLMLKGMGGTMPFYTDMLKNIGVEPEIIRHGKFKAAVEPFMLKQMSPANVKQTMKYVNSIWNDCLTDISKSRGASVSELNKLTDDIAIRNAQTALIYKMVDGLYHPDQFVNFIKAKLASKNTKSEEVKEEKKDEKADSKKDKEKNKKAKKINYISLAKYKDVKVKSEGKVAKDSNIAVIYAEGEIKDGSDSGSITPELTKTIKKIREDEDIKAVVLRVNSPGGSALVSEFILREMKLLKKEKPVVVSFGNVAASGGYYISCAADTIVAEPTTITGSIGVFGLFFTGKDLIENKLGIHLDSYGTNTHANFGGSNPLPLPLGSRKLNDFERNIIQQGVEETYDLFISHVAEGRHMTKEQVDAIGQGRVWAGRDAKEIGLVDVFGGLDDAIQIAKRMANIEGKAKVYFYPKKKEPFEEFINKMTNKAKVSLMENEFGGNYEYYKQMKNVLSHEGIQARLPYELPAQ